jgi:hypothetical protein
MASACSRPFGTATRPWRFPRAFAPSTPFDGANRRSKFTTDASPLDPGEARVTVYHAAVAPAVDVRVLTRDTGAVAAADYKLENGEQTFPVELEVDGAGGVKIDAVVVSPTAPGCSDSSAGSSGGPSPCATASPTRSSSPLGGETAP